MQDLNPPPAAYKAAALPDELIRPVLLRTALHPTRMETQSEGFFDRFAATVGHQVERAWFFAACVLLVLVWVPSFMIIGSVDTWQLIINTATTIVTFLLVALLQNTQSRSTHALQSKLDLMAEALAQVLDQTDDVDESGELARRLRDMVGVEMTATGH